MGIITSPCYMSTVRCPWNSLLRRCFPAQVNPSNIPRHKYVGGTQFCMIMDIEFRRLEKSMIAQAQQRAAPQDKTDHSGIKDDSLLSRQIYRGDSQQPYSRRLTRSFLGNQSPNFTTSTSRATHLVKPTMLQTASFPVIASSSTSLAV